MRVGTAAVLFVCAAAPSLSSAQQGDTIVVTFEQALDIARAYNPTYRRTVNELDLNGPETRAAWATGILPTVRFNIFSTGYAGNLTRRATDFFGNPIANPQSDFVYTSDTQQGLELAWQLRGPSIWNRIRRIRVDNGGRYLAEGLAGEALRVRLRRSYFAALEQEELLRVERAVVDAALSDLMSAQRLFGLGLKTRVDLLEAELHIRQQELVVRQRAGLRHRTLLEVREVLGQSDLPVVLLAAAELPLFDPATLDAEALIARAMAGSASVRNVAASVRSSDLAVKESRGSYWPTLNVSLSVGRFVQGPQAESLFQLGGFGNELFSQFRVRLSLPFFDDVFGNRLAITRAEVERENQRDALRQVRLEVQRAALAGLMTLRDRWESVQIAERSVAIAAEALALAREEYRLGGRTFDQLQPSIRRQAESRRRLIQERYGFVAALVDLEWAVGGPVR